jgi:hypothetical protein
MTSRSTLVLFLALTAAGCGGDDTGDDAPGDDTPGCEPTCPGARDYDAISYHLDAVYDRATQRLAATVRYEIERPAGAGPTLELDAGAAIDPASIHATSDAGDPLVFLFDPAAETLRLNLGTGDAIRRFTLRYETGLSSALRYGGPRDDDPTPSHVVYTDSEPDRARQWLISNDDPADRALFSATFHPAAGLDAIANGTRTESTDTAGGRVVDYALDVPIPTYLMAFAYGELDHVERTTGSVPLALWYRSGLAIDPDATFDMIDDAMATFEAKLGPYPFDSYAVVLLPDYRGGMENATITFNVEASSLGTPSFGLNAHELAHQWFGDWVTMQTYDDLWVKEGMATLLAAEADRARRDRTAAAARLFGWDFYFYGFEAIVDPDLHGLDKYGSGPYERAAWLITQIRHEVGEDAFWASARAVLATYARGSITGEQFIAAFPLSPALAAKAVASLTAHEVPQVTMTATPSGAGTVVDVALDDPAGTLLTPYDLTVIGADGAATTQSLDAETPVTAVVPTGGYLAFDEADVHPDLIYTFQLSAPPFDVMGLVMPTDDTGGTAAARAAFTSRSASAQERGLGFLGIPTTDPEAFVAFYTALDSTRAEALARNFACGAVGQLGPAGAPLAEALEPLLAAPTELVPTPWYGACGPAVAAAFAAERDALILAADPADADRLDYVLMFDYGAEETLDVVGALSATAPTLYQREVALGRLFEQVIGDFYAAPTGATADGYAALFRDRLTGATSERRFSVSFGSAYYLGDLAALPIAGAKLHEVETSGSFQLAVVCAAAEMAAEDDAAWAAFQDAAQPWATLDPSAAAALSNPSTCAQKPAAPGASVPRWALPAGSPSPRSRSLPLLPDAAGMTGTRACRDAKATARTTPSATTWTPRSTSRP